MRHQPDNARPDASHSSRGAGGHIMNLRTFSAPTMVQALVQVKKEMGADALILHTRTYQKRRWFGLRHEEMVEVTAGQDRGGARQARRAPRDAQDHPSHPAKGAHPHAAAHAPSHGASHAPAKTAPAAAGSSLDNRRQLLESPVVTNTVIFGLADQMSNLTKMVQDLVSHARTKDAPDVPEDMFDYYLQLIQNQVAEEVAAQVIRDLRGQLRPEQLKHVDFVREKLLDQLEKMMPLGGPIVRSKKTGPHVVALIGPTGVGKTTTIAKLAAHLKLREGRSVGLITIDTYRIAAVEQLRKYAEIIGSPLKVVMTPEELRDAIAGMSDCEFILIDTAGRCPTDTLRLNELKGFLGAANPDEVHLVVSTAQSQECIERAIERFSAVRVDKIIFTKFDEAVHIGVVLNVVRKVKKSLSYVTTGQNVPDDIEVGRGRRLAQLILGSEL